MTTEPATDLDPDELRPGIPLLEGRIVIGQRIGRGGMSTVYAATDRGRTVAIKIIASDYASDPSVCQRFRNEARLAQALAGHPRLVAPYEVGEAPELGGRLYMTMPLVKGTPLSMVSDRHAWRRWVALMADLARTVADLHERGIVHRDIKPGNVILGDHEGRDVPYLLDFGSAYSEGDGHVPATAGLTRADECPGTKFYMAPEQALGHPTAPSFDIYALALSLYELVLGMHPLDGMTAAEAVRRKCSRELPPLSLRDHRPELPQVLIEAVDRALARDPESRTASAHAFAEQLDAVLQTCANAVALVPTAGTASVDGTTEDLVDPSSVAETEAPAEPAPVQPAEPDEGPSRARWVDTPPEAPESVSPPPARPAQRSRRPPGVWIGLAAVLVLVLIGGAVWALGSGAEPRRDVATVPAASEDDGVLAAVPEPEMETGPSPDPSTTIEAIGESSDDDTVPEDDATPDVQEPTPAKQTAPDPPRGAATKPAGAKAKVRSPYRDPSSTECVAARSDAERAATQQSWSAVLEATARSKCWPRKGPWRALRVQAFFALGKYDACVKAAKNANDPSTRRTAQLCKAALSTKDSAAP